MPFLLAEGVINLGVKGILGVKTDLQLVRQGLGAVQTATTGTTVAVDTMSAHMQAGFSALGAILQRTTTRLNAARQQAKPSSGPNWWDQVQQSIVRAEMRLQSFGATARNVFAAGAGFMGLWVQRFGTAEDAVRNLSTALDTSEESFGANISQMEQFATALGHSTNMTRAQVLALMTQGIQLGINAEQIEQVTRAAIGLSRIRNRSPEETMRAFALAMEPGGNISPLQRMLGHRRGGLSPQSVLNEAERLGARGLVERGQDIDTFSGSLQTLRNTADEAARALGAIFAPAVTKGIWLVAGGIRELTEYIRGLSSAQVESIVKWALFGAEILGVIYLIPKVVMGIRAIWGALLLLSSHPLIALGIAIVGLIVLIATWNTASKAAGKGFGDAFDRATESAKKLRDSLREVTKEELQQKAMADAAAAAGLRKKATDYAAEVSRVEDAFGKLNIQGMDNPGDANLQQRRKLMERTFNQMTREQQRMESEATAAEDRAAKSADAAAKRTGGPLPPGVRGQATHTSNFFEAWTRAQTAAMAVRDETPKQQLAVLKEIRDALKGGLGKTGSPALPLMPFAIPTP